METGSECYNPSTTEKDVRVLERDLWKLKRRPQEGGIDTKLGTEDATSRGYSSSDNCQIKNSETLGKIPKFKSPGLDGIPHFWCSSRSLNSSIGWAYRRRKGNGWVMVQPWYSLLRFQQAIHHFKSSLILIHCLLIFTHSLSFAHEKENVLSTFTLVWRKLCSEASAPLKKYPRRGLMVTSPTGDVTLLSWCKLNNNTKKLNFG